MYKKDTTEVVLGICWVNVHHVHDNQGSHDALTDLISSVQSTLSFVATIAVHTTCTGRHFPPGLSGFETAEFKHIRAGTLGILREHF